MFLTLTISCQVLLNTTLHDVTVPDKRTLELMVDKSLLPVPSASLAALREIGIKKPRWEHTLARICHCIASRRNIFCRSQNAAMWFFVFAEERRAYALVVKSVLGITSTRHNSSHESIVDMFQFRLSFMTELTRRCFR